MSDLAIGIEELGKMYQIGASQGAYRYKSLRESLVQGVNAQLHRILNPKSSLNGSDKIWALKDVSFEVKKGEVIGIIGRNGAGKSTLLKVLSHITEPTKGRVRLHGRVGSLLEVGTGFHPELTGRENIYLNGSILGMKKAEINQKFDEIVAFAEIEKFLDTPVKRYSSGMYVRLAFAVAAHLQPEILLVDEVLAVGDTEFQKKCLGKMGDVANEGRTVLFVSHNMGAIETLCKRGVLLDNGQISCIGNVHDVVSTYIHKNLVKNDQPFINCVRSGNGKIRITGFHLEDSEERLVTYAVSGSPIIFAIEYETKGENCRNVSVGLSVHQNNEGNLLMYYSGFSDVLFSDLPQKGIFRCQVNDCPLGPGNYLVMLRIIENGIEVDWPRIYLPISIHIGDYYKTGSYDGALIQWAPPFLIRGEWSNKPRFEVN
jgi:lipopolysaccharide transport system ATP-binding protein